MSCCRPRVSPGQDDLGTKYVGSKNIKGQRNGAGKLTLEDGRTFSGHFKNGKAVKGLLTYPNGDTFDGAISYTFQPVNGVMTWNLGPNKGCIYKGPFSPQTHVPHGPRGIMVYPSQIIYDGPFHNSAKHGLGIVGYPDTSEFVRFEGEFVNDSVNGQAIIEYKDGSRYSGSMIGSMDRPKRQGRGRTDDPNGDYYVGSYSNDKRQGMGVSVYLPKSSNKRRKSFNSDSATNSSGSGGDGGESGTSDCTEDFTPNGCTKSSGGTLSPDRLRRRSFDDGSVKLPAHNNPKTTSKGVKVAPPLSQSQVPDSLSNKRYRYEGSWAEDKRHGRGRETLPSGGYYDGEWENDLRNGNGEYMFPDRRLYSCVYRNGVQGQMVLKADGSTKVAKYEKRKESCITM